MVLQTIQGAGEAALRRVVPAQLPLDTFDGSAWLGVTPFAVHGLRLRGTAPVPVLSSFAEINVRTYVRVGGRPGIYFLSLDAASWPAVFAARRGYRLPYFHSQIATATRASGPWIHYSVRRTSGDGPPARFEARYRPEGERLPLRDGSVERWLAERYCLYTLDQRGTILPSPGRGAVAARADCRRPRRARRRRLGGRLTFRPCGQWPSSGR